MSYSDLPIQPGLPILVGFLAASLGSLMGPSLYYVGAFVDFFQTHPLCQYKYSNERQQKLPFF